MYCHYIRTCREKERQLSTPQQLQDKESGADAGRQVRTIERPDFKTGNNDNSHQLRIATGSGLDPISHDYIIWLLYQNRKEMHWV
ncbi:hypothetical protein Y1Q_0019209 [Alligator mississippiensis]|uniref:Uncharacterized protein n=1 Tax=Alligator mississippiensis TaxID=8496 RepID=A0A151MQC7_ALLMI|nr:hypothetical protein Y1Q_0019209 [Alligator mississippiensis]